MSRSTVSKYISGDRLMMESETAVKLGKALGVRAEYLLLLDDEMTLAGGVSARPVIAPSIDEERVVVPRLLRIAAGVPEYTPLDGKRNVITDRRSLQKLLGGAIPDGDPARVVFAADVHGDSMAPGITEGDTLIVQRYFPPTRADKEKGIPVVENGKVYVLNLGAVDDDTDGEAKASVKRLILSGGHELHVLSDNTRYPPRTIDLRHVRLIQALILGRPVKLIREL